MVEAPNPSRSRASIDAPPDQDLLSLTARLGDGITELLDGKMALLRLDLEQAVGEYERKAATMAVAAILAGVGAALAACGLAFALAYFLPVPLDPLLARALAFGVVGAIATAGGLVVLRRSAHVSVPHDG